MKKSNKIFSVFILSLCISTSLMSNDAFAVTESSKETVLLSEPVHFIEITQSTQDISTPYSDIIDWRYKTENNKVYRRLYNYSKQKWIGEWELC